MTSPVVRTILGTMAIGGPLNKQATEQVLNIFSSHGHKDVDGALMYQDGKTDRMLGTLQVCKSGLFTNYF